MCREDIGSEGSIREGRGLVKGKTHSSQLGNVRTEGRIEQANEMFIIKEEGLGAIVRSITQQ